MCLAYWGGGEKEKKEVLRQNSRQVHHLRSEVGKVTQREDKQRLDDAHVIGVLGDEAADHSVNHADQRSAQGDDEEGADAGGVVDDFNVGLADFRVSLHHVVQNLQENVSQCQCHC